MWFSGSVLLLYYFLVYKQYSRKFHSCKQWYLLRNNLPKYIRSNNSLSINAPRHDSLPYLDLQQLEPIVLPRGTSFYLHSSTVFEIEQEQEREIVYLNLIAWFSCEPCKKLSEGM